MAHEFKRLRLFADIGKMISPKKPFTMSFLRENPKTDSFLRENKINLFLPYYSLFAILWDNTLINILLHLMPFVISYNVNNGVYG